MVYNKYISPFSHNFDAFNQSILREEIFVSKNRITLFDCSFAEKIVSRKISHDKISIIDRIKNIVLHIFSKEFRESKKIIKTNLVRFRKQYFEAMLKNVFIPPNQEDNKIDIRLQQAQKKQEKEVIKDTTNYIKDLPKDLVVEILSGLNKNDIQSFRRTCTQFKDIHKDPILLTKLIEKNMPFSLNELISLSKHCGHLVKKLAPSLIPTDQEVIHLLNHYPNLQTLALSCQNLSDVSLESISNLKNLKELYLLDAKFTDECLMKIANLKLEKIIIDSENVTDKGLEIISNYNDLKALWISRSAITDEGIKKILELNLLKVILLCGCNQLTDISVEKIIEKKNLKLISISFCNKITLEAIKKIDPNVWDFGNEIIDYFFPDSKSESKIDPLLFVVKNFAFLW